MSLNEEDITDAIAPGNEVIYKRFQDLYISLRNSEQRIYSDEEVGRLPEVNEENPYEEEWKLRKDSCERLVKHLTKKNRPLKILEVGCGNGWLSHRLAQINQSVVIGVDINSVELEQASRVFAKQDNLSFIYGDISCGLMNGEKFDVIVFAASVQYFQSLRGVVNIALDLLNEEGEIHILDTHFYERKDVEAARERSEAYFRKMGFENMSKLYFHHSLEELESFNYELLYDAHAVLNKFFNRRNPFNWICIKSNK
jgi:ubiquinone/menaquinone biosynthesis C-methylase UbiE